MWKGVSSIVEYLLLLKSLYMMGGISIAGKAKKMAQFSLAEIKQLKDSGELTVASGDGHETQGHGAPQQNYRFTPVPMFLPTRTFGNHMASVVTRQKFIDTNIGWWLRWRTTKVAAIALGILAIVLIPSNVYLAAAAGLGAGWLYGQYVWSNFYVTQLLGKRRLLEST